MHCLSWYIKNNMYYIKIFIFKNVFHNYDEKICKKDFEVIESLTMHIKLLMHAEFICVSNT